MKLEKLREIVGDDSQILDYLLDWMTEDDQFDFCEDIMDRFGIKEEDDNNSEWE